MFGRRRARSVDGAMASYNAEKLAPAGPLGTELLIVAPARPRRGALVTKHLIGGQGPTGRRRRGSIAEFLRAVAAIKVISSNAQALFMHRRYIVRARRKMQYLRTLAAQADFETALREFSGFIIMGAPPPRLGGGGVMLMVRRALLESGWSLGEGFVVEEGRAYRLDLCCAGGRLRLGCVSSYFIPIRRSRSSIGGACCVSSIRSGCE